MHGTQEYVMEFLQITILGRTKSRRYREREREREKVETKRRGSNHKMHKE